MSCVGCAYWSGFNGFQGVERICGRLEEEVVGWKKW